MSEASERALPGRTSSFNAQDMPARPASRPGSEQPRATGAPRHGPAPGSLSTLQRRQRAASREAILKATNDYLALRAFDEITIEDILTRASVSRATFYRHFKSRYEVALALYEQVFGRALSHFEALTDAMSPEAAQRWIESLAAQYRAEGRASVLILQLGVTDARFHERLRRDRKWLIESLGGHLAAFRRAGGETLAARRQHARADLLLMLLDRVCVEVAVHGGLADPEPYFEAAAQALTSFLAKGARPPDD